MTAKTTTNPTPPPNDTTATLTVGLAVGAAMSVEASGKSLGDHVVTATAAGSIAKERISSNQFFG